MVRYFGSNYFYPNHPCLNDGSASGVAQLHVRADTQFSHGWTMCQLSFFTMMATSSSDSSSAMKTFRHPWSQQARCSLGMANSAGHLIFDDSMLSNPRRANSGNRDLNRVILAGGWGPNQYYQN